MSNNTSQNLNIGSVQHQERILYNLFYGQFPKDAVLKLESVHFTEDRFKIIFSLVKDYLQKHKELPNPSNIAEIIKNNKSSTEAQKEDWLKLLRNLYKLNTKALNGEIKNDFNFIRDSVKKFIQVQSIKNISENDLRNIIETNNLENVNDIVDKLREIITIGDTDDDPDDIEDFDEDIYINRYKGFIPTGLKGIDDITGGGLPKGKLGMFIAAQGVGKSTILIQTSVAAFKHGAKVLHVIFGENTKDDVQLLVSTALTGISLKEAKKNPNKTHNEAKKIIKKFKNDKHAVLKIKRFNSNEVTIPFLKAWVQSFQKRVGYTFDQINIDYVDEMISHKKNHDEWTGQKDVVSSFLDMLVEMDICGWTATQAKKEANNKKVLEISDAGGSVAKVKKAQVVIGIGRDSEDRNNNRASFSLLKSNISPSGHIFENCLFDTSKMKFVLTEPTGGTIVEEFDDDSLTEDIGYQEVKEPTRQLLVEVKNNELNENVLNDIRNLV